MKEATSKAAQASGVLLREVHGAQMSYLRLLKLLYIADRESLKEIGQSITGDRVVAMKHGPVLSNTLDMIKGESFGSSDWCRHIHRDGYQISLICDPGISLLSKFEIRKLQEVTQRYATLDDWELVELTHTFPEWKRNDPGESSKKIPLDHILEAVGRLADRAGIEAQHAKEAAVNRLLEDFERKQRA